MGTTGGTVSILHVDDTDQARELTVSMLERERERFEVEGVATATAGLDRLEEATFDCIVSDYRMVGADGLEFLERVRDRDEGLPFILFTGRGSEEIASEAITSGVTDYIERDTGTRQYTLLANRIENAVEKYRATRRLAEHEERLEALLADSHDVITVLDEDGTIQYTSPAVERVLGYDVETVVGESLTKHVHPEDEGLVEELFGADDTDTTGPLRREFRIRAADGEWRWMASTGDRRWHDAADGYVLNTRDVTEEIEQRRRLERENERLAAFASIVSHDLRNPLNVVIGSLQLLDDEFDSAHIDRARRAATRMEDLVADLLTLARQGAYIEEVESVDLAQVARLCWETVETREATLRVTATSTIQADEGRLRQLFENLFRNSVEHGGEGVHVRVGELDDGTGFYVADDGVGIPESERPNTFERGYSTAESGTGFGLSIVSGVVDAHGWTVRVTESEAGGARFEFEVEVDDDR